MWKRLVINGIIKRWPRYERLWVSEIEEGWFISYVEDNDYLVLRGCDELTQKTAGVVLGWREKHLIFEAEDMKPGKGSLRGKLMRVAKKVECTDGSLKAKEMVDTLALKMAIGGDVVDEIKRLGSVTKAFWYFQLYQMGMDLKRYLKVESRRQMAPWDVLWWRAGVLKMKRYDLLRTARGMAQIAGLALDGANKWRLVQEAKRIDHTQIGGLYGAGKALADDATLRLAFLERMRKVSNVLEDYKYAPIEYLYLTAR